MFFLEGSPTKLEVGDEFRFTHRKENLFICRKEQNLQIRNRENETVIHLNVQRLDIPNQKQLFYDTCEIIAGAAGYVIKEPPEKPKEVHGQWILTVALP